jgi:conjugal transfer pilus assembly protein TraK
MARARLLQSLGLLAAITVTSPTSLFALQRVDARDGVSVEVLIALNEPTRIKIDGDVISDVFGNIYSTNCGAADTATIQPGGQPVQAINPVGEIALECDKERGEIYVKPVGPGAKPINLFVSSGKATYTLILKRVDMPADTIVIVDRTLARQLAANVTQVASRAPSHERALKAMLFAMARDEVPNGIRVEEVNRRVELWAGVRFTLLRAFDGQDLAGERYLLTNVGHEPMLLAEEHFDREGGDVVAVSIENRNLAPNESTSVFVIRDGSKPWLH